jgi:hypothetical protein
MRLMDTEEQMGQRVGNRHGHCIRTGNTRQHAKVRRQRAKSAHRLLAAVAVSDGGRMDCFVQGTEH